MFNFITLIFYYCLDLLLLTGYLVGSLPCSAHVYNGASSSSYLNTFTFSPIYSIERVMW